MRIVPLMLFGVCWAQAPFGTWKMNASRSTLSNGIHPKSLILRINPHPKGEVFTLDCMESDGRTTSSSTILYLDSEPRRFSDFGCSGIQSSRRADAWTVEIVRMCSNGTWMRILQRASARPNELVLEIIEESADGRHFDSRLTLEKQ